jgi:hypothetical protein
MGLAVGCPWLEACAANPPPAAVSIARRLLNTIGEIRQASGASRPKPPIRDRLSAWFYRSHWYRKTVRNQTARVPFATAWN